MTPTSDNGLSLREKAAILSETLTAIMTAARFRVFDGKGTPPLPEVAEDIPFDSSRAELTADFVSGVTRLVVIWKRRICFYRSYAIVCVLRARGAPVALNFGYRWEGPAGGMAHCWMTLEGKLFRENQETGRIYTSLLGERGSAVRFWADPDNIPANGEKTVKKEIAQ